MVHRGADLYAGECHSVTTTRNKESSFVSYAVRYNTKPINLIFG